LLIRPQTEADYAAAVDLINTVYDEGLTVEGYANDTERRAQNPSMVLIAEVNGQVVGRAAGGLDPRLPPGELSCMVTVHPTMRRRGVGHSLWDALQPFYAQQNPASLRSTVSDEPEVAGWAERRGFRVMHHQIEGWLDLSSFDPAAFAAFTVPAGVRLSTYAAEHRQTERAESRLYQLYSQHLRDTPDGGDWAIPPEEEWIRWALHSDGSWSEGIWLAIDPAGDWVGLSLMGRYTDGSQRGHIYLTGVRPSYRGVGLATALKVRAASQAKADGLVGLTTLNDATNKPILAVNQRMGFRKKSGIYRLIKPWRA